MLNLIDELIRHKWWANFNLLRSVADHAPAAQDEEMRRLLHHILVANRYWLLLSLKQPYWLLLSLKQPFPDSEMQVPDSHSGMTSRFTETQHLEMEWLANLAAADLDAPLQPRALPGVTVTVAQAAIQVALHSHGHRSQCASRLRALGGTPSPMDFVLWAVSHTDTQP